jgi:hypothetical protein
MNMLETYMPRLLVHCGVQLNTQSHKLRRMSDLPNFIHAARSEQQGGPSHTASSSGVRHAAAVACRAMAIYSTRHLFTRAAFMQPVTYLLVRNSPI